MAKGSRSGSGKKGPSGGAGKTKVGKGSAGKKGAATRKANKAKAAKAKASAKAYMKKGSKLLERSGKGNTAGNLRKVLNSPFSKEGPSAAAGSSKEPK